VFLHGLTTIEVLDIVPNIAVLVFHLEIGRVIKEYPAGQSNDIDTYQKVIAASPAYIRLVRDKGDSNHWSDSRTRDLGHVYHTISGESIPHWHQLT
jgi:hypothetical protein